MELTLTLTLDFSVIERNKLSFSKIIGRAFCHLQQEVP